MAEDRTDCDMVTTQATRYRDGSRGIEISTHRALVVAVMMLVLAVPKMAFAYVGPGVGLTVIGAALAVVASVVLAIVGFVWYPIKKLGRAMARRAGRARGHHAHD